MTPEYSKSRYGTYKEEEKKHEVFLDENAILYRLVPSEYYSKEVIVDAGAIGRYQDVGRWNDAKQGTIYAANNVLICFAECLYRMYIGALDHLSKNKCKIEVASKYLRREYKLAIVKLKKIDGLALATAESTYTVLNSGLRASLLVHPDAKYRRMHDFAQDLRLNRWNGIAYPSARHRTDPEDPKQNWYSAYALFNNESDKIVGRPETVIVNLQLIDDRHITDGKPSVSLEPHKSHYLHASLGYFEFGRDPQNMEKLKSLRQRKLLMPTFQNQYGYIDFVRRTYKFYPKDAILGSSRSHRK